MGESFQSYYPADSKVAVSLTAGFDSRSVLAFAPEQVRDRVTTYTYGVPGCSELEVSIMRQIKKAFDPLSIMNPGKIFGN